MFHPGMIIDERLNQLTQVECPAQAAMERRGRPEPSGLPRTIKQPALLLAAAIIAVWLAWVAIAA